MTDATPPERSDEATVLGWLLNNLRDAVRPAPADSSTGTAEKPMTDTASALLRDIALYLQGCDATSALDELEERMPPVPGCGGVGALEPCGECFECTAAHIVSGFLTRERWAEYEQRARVIASLFTSHLNTGQAWTEFQGLKDALAQAHRDLEEARATVPEWKCSSCGATTRIRLADNG